MRLMTRVALGVVLSVVVLSGVAEAQTSVAFALVPKIGTGPLSDPFRPKYTDPGALGVGLDIPAGSPFSDLNDAPIYIIKANLSAAQRTALQAQSDALVIPSNLDSLVSGLAVTKIQSTLEAVNLPAEWVTTDLTYRQVWRRVRRMITFRQRYFGLNLGARLFAAGITLDTRINQLTAGQRQALIDTSDNLGLDRSGVTNTMTIRVALRILADQLPDDAVFEGN